MLNPAGILLLAVLTSSAAVGRAAEFPRNADSVELDSLPLEGKVQPVVHDSIRINGYVWYTPAQKRVSLTLVGGHDGVNGGMNFNGAGHGGATLTVPVGWRVDVTFRNHDAALPHSVIIVPAATPVPVLPGAPAFEGAVSGQPLDGLAEGEESRFGFSASRAGDFLILCAVPGHGTAGMWISLSISSAASRPSYR